MDAAVSRTARKGGPVGTERESHPEEARKTDAVVRTLAASSARRLHHGCAVPRGGVVMNR